MLSIVVPTLNETEALPQTLGHVHRAAAGAPIEVIVSDCCSRDGTADLARSLGVRVIEGGRSRADALNRGAAAVAGGGVLLFLHADTVLPHDFARKIARAMADPFVVGGAFEFEWGEHALNRGLNRLLLRGIVFCNRIRFRHSRGFFGDQAVFVRRDAFERLGGFPDVRLMEDLRFCRRLGLLGRTAILQPPVKTSPRRFVTRGVIRQFAQDLSLLCCDSWGVCPEDLWAHYNRWNAGERGRAHVNPFGRR